VCDKGGRHNKKKRPETGPTREKPTGLLAVKFGGFVFFGFFSFRSARIETISTWFTFDEKTSPVVPTNAIR
jgi:hypothetical protein